MLIILIINIDMVC